MKENKLELYFHIPFCVKKCLYCDFLSAPADASAQDAYMEALLRETLERSASYREYTVDTIFIGGGTPSVVKAEWLERLLETVRENFAVAEDAEITLEVNPGTVDARKLASYHKAGINRLSIGLQSANDEELKRLGRIHTWQEFRETYCLAREAGFGNINVDVMSALPGQSRDSYMDTLEKVVKLSPQPEHISAYSLIVEEGTPFAKMQEKGLLKLPDEESERWMYEQTEKVLEKYGFSRYEISNYAKPGFACRHNCGYWQRTSYVGFGIGAASLVGNARFRNEEDYHSYLENPLGCRCDMQELSMEEQMEEFMFLGLRMTAGVSLQEFRTQFGCGMEEVYHTVIEKNIVDGLLRYREETDGNDIRLLLTPRGTDISNYVMAQFLL